MSRGFTREEMARGGTVTASRYDMQARGRLGGRKPRLAERCHARRLFEANEKVIVVASVVGVSDKTAWRWRQLWKEGEL